MRNKYKFVILKNAESKQPYRAVIIANNSQPIWTSENYVQKGSAINAIRQTIKRIQKGLFIIQDKTRESKLEVEILP